MDESLMRLLHDAFPVRPLPERPVTGHRCDECDEVDEKLAGREWPDVASAFPGYCHDVYSLLTPAGRAYYLPAYMVAALGRECGLQGISLESALEDGRLDPSAFTPLQRAAVVRWAAAYYRQVDDDEPPAFIAERWEQAAEQKLTEPAAAPDGGA